MEMRSMSDMIEIQDLKHRLEIINGLVGELITGCVFSDDDYEIVEKIKFHSKEK